MGSAPQAHRAFLGPPTGSAPEQQQQAPQQSRRVPQQQQRVPHDQSCVEQDQIRLVRVELSMQNVRPTSLVAYHHSRDRNLMARSPAANHHFEDACPRSRDRSPAQANSKSALHWQPLAAGSTAA
jgi:hypothetical protein